MNLFHHTATRPESTTLIGTYRTRDMAQAEASIHNGSIVTTAPDAHHVYVTSPWVRRNQERRQHVHEIESAS